MACSGGCGCGGTCGGGAAATKHDAVDVIDAPPGCKCVCECVEPKGQPTTPTFNGIESESAAPPVPSAPGGSELAAWSAQLTGPDDLTSWFRARTASGVAARSLAGVGGSSGQASAVVGRFQSPAGRFVASFSSVPAPIPIARVRSSSPFGIAEPFRAPAMPVTYVPTEVAEEHPLPTIDVSIGPGRAAVRGRLSVAPPPGSIVPADGWRDGVGPSFPRREALAPRWTGVARRNGPAASPIARALWDPFDETDPDAVSLRRVPGTVAVSANGDGRPRALVADPRGPAVPDLVSLPLDIEEGTGFATNGVPEDSIADTDDTTRDAETGEPATSVGRAALEVDAVSPPTHEFGDSAAGEAVHPPQAIPRPGSTAAQRLPGAQPAKSSGFGEATGPAVAAQAGRSMTGSIGPQSATGLEGGSIADRRGGRGGGALAAAAAAAHAYAKATESFEDATDAKDRAKLADAMFGAMRLSERAAAVAKSGFSNSETAQERIDEATARMTRDETRQKTVGDRRRNAQQANSARALKADARAARDAATAAKREVANFHGQGEPKANKAASKAVADWKKAAGKAADAAKAAERSAKYGSAADAAKRLEEAKRAAKELKAAAEKAAAAITDAKKAAEAKKNGTKTPEGTPPAPAQGPEPGGDPPKQPGDPPAPGGAGSTPEEAHPECGPLPCGKCANPCSGWGVICRCRWEKENEPSGGGGGRAGSDQPPGFGSGWYGLPQPVSDDSPPGPPPPNPDSDVRPNAAELEKLSTQQAIDLAPHGFPGVWVKTKKGPTTAEGKEYLKRIVNSLKRIRELEARLTERDRLLGITLSALRKAGGLLVFIETEKAKGADTRSFQGTKLIEIRWSGAHAGSESYEGANPWTSPLTPFPAPPKSSLVDQRARDGWTRYGPALKASWETVAHEIAHASWDARSFANPNDAKRPGNDMTEDFPFEERESVRYENLLRRASNRSPVVWFEPHWGRQEMDSRGDTVTKKWFYSSDGWEQREPRETGNRGYLVSPGTSKTLEEWKSASSSGGERPDIEYNELQWKAIEQDQLRMEERGLGQDLPSPPGNR